MEQDSEVTLGRCYSVPRVKPFFLVVARPKYCSFAGTHMAKPKMLRPTFLHLFWLAYPKEFVSPAGHFKYLGACAQYTRRALRWFIDESAVGNQIRPNPSYHHFKNQTPAAQYSSTHRLPWFSLHTRNLVHEGTCAFLVD